MRNLRTLFSPSVVALVISLVGLAFTFFPPDVYEEILYEKNFMFLNAKLILYVLCCLIMFIIGTFIFSKKYINITTKNSLYSSDSKEMFFVVSIFVIIVLVIRTITMFRGLGIDSLSDILRPGMGLSITEYRIKFDSIMSSSILSWIRPFSLIASIYLVSKAYRMGSKYYTMPIITSLLNLMYAYISQTRGEMILFVGIMFITIINLKLSFKKIKVYQFYAYLLLIILVSVFAFVVIDVNRGGMLAGRQGLSYTLVGYFISEFNRLALILDGKLRLPGAGEQAYAFYNVLYPPFSSRIELLNFGNWLGFTAPGEQSVWSSSFNSVKVAKLDENFNWFTIYGSVYSDLGWLSPIWFLGYGILSGFFWNLYRKGELLGIYVYPWFWISIITWWGAFNVLISSPDTTWIIIFSLAFMLIERIQIKNQGGRYSVKYRISSRNI
ncbi:hypothetical protein DEIGR_100282 [Deinococcus grandis]|uniref:Oligosaccharide repeat unit polymerase n=1 Tax=Deinococcus grandis TaxID=57498 RepID=A0A100HIY5_9DEIO|nr:hypothetical protein DEGR_29970 [Deinococcus grandis]GAQ20255.1 hypothetical protein DEIGR_100282 [Deinococcus grandis]